MLFSNAGTKNHHASLFCSQVRNPSDSVCNPAPIARDYSCIYCKKLYSTKAAMMKHIKTSCPAHSAENGKFTCHQCNMTFLHPQTKNQHISYCTKNIASSSNPLSHSFNPQIKDLTAASLEVEEKDVYAHRNNVTKKSDEIISSCSAPEVNNSSYKCPYCDATFSNKWNMKIHEGWSCKANPEREKKFSCGNCNMSFSNEEAQKQHVNGFCCVLPENLEEKQEVIDENVVAKEMHLLNPGKEYNTENDSQKLDELDCVIDSEVFNGKLSRYSEISTPSNDVKEIECHFCRNRFVNESTLASHTLNSCPANPNYNGNYRCFYCNMSFYNEYVKNQHMRLYCSTL